jgi:hypothetical protein
MITPTCTTQEIRAPPWNNSTVKCWVLRQPHVPHTRESLETQQKGPTSQVEAISYSTPSPSKPQTTGIYSRRTLTISTTSQKEDTTPWQSIAVTLRSRTAPWQRRSSSKGWTDLA